MELLLDTVKWSAVVGAAALVLTALKPALDRRYSARWRYWVWLVMAALLLLAPVQWEKLAPRTAAVLPAAEPPVVVEVPRMSISREEGLVLRRSGAAPSVPAETVRRVDLDAVLPRVWLAGGAVWGLWRLLGTALFLHRARRWSRSPSQDTALIYAGLCRDLGIKRPPALRISSAAGSPLLAGLLRPRLLLPGEDWGERELGFILRHELTHYRRRDLWYKLVLLGAVSLHWFNPLVHLLVREAEADLELTCDDLVMAGAEPADRRAYSETLLASLRRQKGLLGRSSLSTHFYGGAGVMRERFRNILGVRGRRWGAAALALALTATLAAACTFGLRQAPPESGAPADTSAPTDPGGPELPEEERWARGIMERDAARLSQEQGAEVTGQTLDYLTAQGSWTVDGTAYSAWRLGYWLELAGGEPVVREGWGILGQEPSGDSGGMWHEGETRPWAVETAGYTWEEYVVCYSYGMQLSDAEGWPYRTEAFVSAYLDGHNTWAADPQNAALEYLSKEFGLTAQGGVNTLYAFENGTSLLLETTCEDQSVRLLARQERVEGSEAPIWQIRSVQWSGDALLYTDRAELGRGVTGLIELYGRRPSTGGSWGVSRILWTPYGGTPQELSVLEAATLIHPAWDTSEPSACTDSWTPDGGLVLEDVNFDGYLDLGLQAAVTAYNLPYYYWTYNPDTGGFDFAFWLLGPMIVDGENRQLICETHSGPEYYTEYYAYDHTGQLYLARRDTQDLSLASGPVYSESFDHPANDWRGGSYAALTADELAAFADYFNAPESNGLLRFPYAQENFQDLADYLPILFYDHSGSFADMTEAERAILGPMELDGRKLTTDYMADYLFDSYLLVREEAEGVIAQAGEDLGRYLPEYDAYYSQRGDTELRTYAFDSGLRFSDGSVTLWYTADIWNKADGELTIQWDQSMCVNLSSLEDGWYVTRNSVNE